MPNHKVVARITMDSLTKGLIEAGTGRIPIEYQEHLDLHKYDEIEAEILSNETVSGNILINYRGLTLSLARPCVKLVSKLV